MDAGDLLGINKLLFAGDWKGSNCTIDLPYGGG